MFFYAKTFGDVITKDLSLHRNSEEILQQQIDDSVA